MSDTPTDIIRQVLRKALKNEFNISNDDEIEFGNISQSSGSGVSDNFGGELKLVSFTYSIKDQAKEELHSYIVKSLPLNPRVKDMLEEVQFTIYLFPHVGTILLAKYKF